MTEQVFYVQNGIVVRVFRMLLFLIYQNENPDIDILNPESNREIPWEAIGRAMTENEKSL